MSAATEPGVTLHPYQEKAHQGILKSWENYDRVLLVIPTAGGKTIVFSFVIKARLHLGPTLVLAHRDELIDQAIQKISQCIGATPEREKAGDCASLNAPIVVGSVQTLSRDNRLKRFARTHFKTIIVDEAHRILADSYQKVLNFFVGAKVLGVTATPDRGDARNLGQYFEEIAYEISLIDLIKDGYICPIKVRTAPLTIDISGVSTRAGDFSDDELGAVLDPLLEEIALAIQEFASNRKTLIFVPLIATADRFAHVLRGLGLAAEMICGVSKDRREILDRFRTGETKILVNSMLLTEGVDIPSIDCVIPLRPTKIRSLLAQMIGRGCRLSPGKEDLLVLDFLWQTNRHRLVQPASLIARDEAEADQITDALAKSDDGDLIEAQEAALAEREASLARQLEENRRRRGELLDILEVAARYHAPEIVDFEPFLRWHLLPVTPGQKEILAKYKIPPGLAKNRGHASEIINSVFRYNEVLPATEKQLRYMRFLGHPDPFSEAITKQEASRWIAARKAGVTQPERSREKPTFTVSKQREGSL
jgi:superfamily II DNA or RNA helicase